MARILIVEDESIIALFLQKIVERMGYQVSAAVKSGEEAIEKAGRGRPDLVLMDIKLRGALDGISAANTIYRRYGIPSIFLTAYSSEEFRKRYSQPLIAEPVHKPIQEEELRDRIETVLRIKSETLGYS